MKKKDPFGTLTKRERGLLGLTPEKEEGPFAALERQVKALTRGENKKQLDRDLRKMERPEWE